MSYPVSDTPPFHTPSASAFPSRTGSPAMDRMDPTGSTGTLRTMVPSNSASQSTLHNGSNGRNGRQSLPPSGLGGIQEKEKQYSVPNPPPATHTVQLDTEPNRVIVAGKDQTPGEVDPALKPPKVNKKLEYVIKPMAIAATVLLIVLWATALWIFGCNHNAQHRAYKLKVSRGVRQYASLGCGAKSRTSCGAELRTEIARGYYARTSLRRRSPLRTSAPRTC